MVMADVYEQDIGLVRTGSKARITIGAYPDQRFEGRSLRLPDAHGRDRTVPCAWKWPSRQLLKPAMFAEVELRRRKGQGADGADFRCHRQRHPPRGPGPARGRPLRAREVKLGARNDSYVEVMDGVKDGEQVVVTANFLIDAESNLKAAIAGFGTPGREAQPAQRAPPPSSDIARTERSRPSTRNPEPRPSRTGPWQR